VQKQCTPCSVRINTKSFSLCSIDIDLELEQKGVKGTVLLSHLQLGKEDGKMIRDKCWISSSGDIDMEREELKALFFFSFVLK